MSAVDESSWTLLEPRPCFKVISKKNSVQLCLTYQMLRGRFVNPHFCKLIVKWLDGKYSCFICGLAHGSNSSRSDISSISGDKACRFFFQRLNSFRNVIGYFPRNVGIWYCIGKLTGISKNGYDFAVGWSTFSAIARCICFTAEWMAANASPQLPLNAHAIDQWCRFITLSWQRWTPKPSKGLI